MSIYDAKTKRELYEEVAELCTEFYVRMSECKVQDASAHSWAINHVIPPVPQRPRVVPVAGPDWLRQELKIENDQVWSRFDGKGWSLVCEKNCLDAIKDLLKTPVEDDD